MGKPAPAPHLADMRNARWEPGRQLNKAKRTIASLRADLERSNKKHEEHKARLRELSSRSFEVIQESYAEDWKWRKKYRSLYKKHWELVTANNLQRVGDNAFIDDVDSMAAEEDDDLGRPEGSEPLNRLSYICDAIDNMLAVGDDDDHGEAYPLSVGTLAASNGNDSRSNDGGDDDSPRRDDNALEDEATYVFPVAVSRVVDGSSASQERGTSREEHVIRQPMQQRRFRKLAPTASKSLPQTETYQKWRGRQRMRIVAFFTNMFGTEWRHEFSANPEKEPRLTDQQLLSRQTDTYEVVDVLANFFRHYPTLFNELAKPTCCGKDAAKKVEKATVDRMQEHWDRISCAVFTKCQLTERGYQDLINYTSKECLEGVWVQVRCPQGTAVPHFRPKNQMLEDCKRMLRDLGLNADTPGATLLDPKKVLEARVECLARDGLVAIADGMTLPVQFLGDATTVWKSMRVNGTTLVLKVVYNPKKVSPHKGTSSSTQTTTSSRSIEPAPAPILARTLPYMHQPPHHPALAPTPAPSCTGTSSSTHST